MKPRCFPRLCLSFFPLSFLSSPASVQILAVSPPERPANKYFFQISVRMLDRMRASSLNPERVQFPSLCPSCVIWVIWVSLVCELDPLPGAYIVCCYLAVGPEPQRSWSLSALMCLFISYYFLRSSETFKVNLPSTSFS